MRLLCSTLCVSLLAAGCRGDARPANPTCLAPERAVGGDQFSFDRRFAAVDLNAPIALTSSPAIPGWWYVAEQGGRIVRFQDNASAPEVVLSLAGQVSDGMESGLLGLAFHPDFASTGAIFVNYTNDDAGLETRIARFTSTDGGRTFGSEQILFRVDQPFSNHNAGHLAFGPDGMLYFGLGDGGSAGDPLGNGQDLQAHLGKMLRIDVDGGTPYAIPQDNPFANGGGQPEIWAWGLRNPWRFSFDGATGDLWLGDVGQNSQEEVDRIVRAGNYGWNTTEGKLCFSPPSGCDESDLVKPEAVYDNEGGASVVGGVVYRGDALPGLDGAYLYSDFYTDDVWALRDGRSEVVARAPGPIVHWEVGADGEVWALTWDGAIYTLVPDGQPPTGGPAELLSEIGCFEPDNLALPLPGVLPYDVAHPFWSDGADKRRWLAIPDDTTIQVGADGAWDLPIGSVLLKHFTRGGVPIETRMLARHDDGGWAGYAWVWRDDGSDADLISAQRDLDVGGPWTVPSRSGCLACHNDVTGGTLGLHDGQLGAQAVDLAELGVLGVAEDRPAPEPWPGVTSGGSLDERARTYLHVNCATCHQPEGGSRTDLDFRRTAPLDEGFGLCVAPTHGDLGIPGAQVITPGDAENSLVWRRMIDPGTARMPPIGSHQTDTVGAELIASWIAALPPCGR